MAGGISQSGRTQLAQLFAQGRRSVTPSEAADIFGSDTATAAKTLSRWAKQGWVRRVRRGLYIPVPLDAQDPARWTEDALFVAHTLWSPCYFTGWTSANHWALTEQTFRTTIVKTTQGVRSSKHQYAGHDYYLVHASAQLLEWGTTQVWQGQTRIAMADPARTVIDILDNPSLSGGIRLGVEILEAYLHDKDPGQLVTYADRLGNRTVFKRLGYIAEVLGIPAKELVTASQNRITHGRSVLDPSAPPGGNYSDNWELQINVTLDQGGAS
jgi:predicted transcriptional regulator of viral defense system